MHSIEIPEIKKRYWIPETLRECDRRQYLDMAKLIFMYQTGELSLTMFRIMAFSALLNIHHSKAPAEQTEKWENLYLCSELIDSFFEKNDEDKIKIIQDYVHNPVPYVRYKLRKFIGPKDAFEGMTYGELEDAIGELMNFQRFGEMESLVKLFAIFYRRPKEKYGSFNMDARVKFFDTLDIRYIYGFYLLFVSFFHYLTKECMIMVDGKELDLRVLFREDKSGAVVDPNEPETLGLRSASFQLAESGVFGTLEELRNADAIMVLIRLYDMMVRHEKAERERKQQQQNQQQ